MKKSAVLFTLICIVLYAVPVYALDVPSIEGWDIFSQTAREMTNGSFSLNPIEILNGIAARALSEVKYFIAGVASILVMALLSSTVSTLNSSLGENDGGRTAFFVFFTIISGLALSCFHTALSYGTAVIEQMTSFMNKLTPVLIITLFTCCKGVSAAAFEPVLSAAVYVASIVIEKCLVPLMTFSAVLSAAGNVGDGMRISGFTKIIKSVSKWLMAFVITLFTGINAIYGFTAASLDAAGAKTIKFAVGSLVPVVGGFLSDTLDTVVSSASILKNAVGAAGIVIMCGICIVPIIKIWIMQLVLKLCAAVAEPVTDSRITAMLWGMSEAVTSVFGVVVLTAVLFLINICIILAASGV